MNTDFSFSQASIFFFIGLGLVIFITGFYTFFQMKGAGKNKYYFLFFGFSRFLIFGYLLICIFQFKFLTSKNKDQKNINLIFIDQNIVGQPYFPNELKRLDSVFKISKTPYRFLNFKGNSFETKNKYSANSWSELMSSVARLKNNIHFNRVFVVSDGNLTHVGTDNFTGKKIEIIPLGPVVNRQKVQFSIPQKSILSVPNEIVHIPVEIYGQQITAPVKIQLNCRLNGRVIAARSITLDPENIFKSMDFELSQSKIGQYTLEFSFDKKNSKYLKWFVKTSKAVVMGFAKSPSSDLGVIDRVAKAKSVRIEWKFMVMNLGNLKGDYFLFDGLIPDKSNWAYLKNKSVWYLNLNSSQVNELISNGFVARENLKDQTPIKRKLLIPETNFWAQQMDEFRLKSNYKQVDSLLAKWMDNTYLSVLKIDSLDLNVGENLKLGVEEGRNNALLQYLTSKKQVALVDFNLINPDEVYDAGNEQNTPLDYLWKNNYFWICMVGLITSEWLIRKWLNLK